MAQTSAVSKKMKRDLPKCRCHGYPETVGRPEPAVETGRVAMKSGSINIGEDCRPEKNLRSEVVVRDFCILPIKLRKNDN